MPIGLRKGNMGFSKDFIWGTATASYQIEGGAFEDGRGLSVWDQFSATPGKVRNGDTGAVACDSYHRMEEDIRLLKEIGVKAYRFSLSWPRLLPDGTGRLNEKGFAYYDRLIDSLLKNGIEPYITLFHWDFPLELYYKGGWLNRDVKNWFGEFAMQAARRYGDRVQGWITENEPQCYIGLGHRDGIHAPGLQLPMNEVVRCWHNSLAAHGMAVQAIRQNAAKTPHIGLVSCGDVPVPTPETEENIDACRHCMFDRHIGVSPRLEHIDLLEPAVFGRYPENLIDLLPDYYAQDMSPIAQPLDFIGLNIYAGFPIAKGKEGWPEVQPDVRGRAETATEWPVRPDSLYWACRFINERYHLPVLITENGMANLDWKSADGQVHDPQRVDFINRYLTSLKRAADEGIPVEGYFYWSLLDNYEWASGYSRRFGLTYVDYADMSRTLKDSAYRYRDIIAANGENLKG